MHARSFNPVSDSGPSFPREVPSNEHNIPQFTVRQLGDDKWEATATYELTDLMATMGCRAVLRAETMPDLELIASAERIRASMVRAAEAQPGEEQPASGRRRGRLAMLRHLLRGERFALEMDGDDTLLARPSRVNVRPLRITCGPWPPLQDALWFMVDGRAFEAAETIDHIETMANLIGARLLAMGREAQRA
ncbi:hypothetical protein ACFHW2_11665 [Actinomadura sp. LOL_016]|uniref:hypothetical protein n=1 Tax=unclassified Actinomadura TaxID=2626254 RepID=UPI003A812760